MTRQRGFTLLEILVAMAVLAIALAAVVGSASSHVNNLNKLYERTLAEWVAMNQVTAWQLRSEWPPAGTREGDIAMAKRDWHWRITVSNTDDASIRRLDVEVVGNNDNDAPPLSHLIAYLGRPPR